MIGSLNINHFENKFKNIRGIGDQASMNILCIDETIFDSLYPDSKFHHGDIILNY